MVDFKSIETFLWVVTLGSFRAAGEKLNTTQPAISKLIGLRSEMMAEVSDRSAMRGVLRLGVAETIVHTWLSRLIKSVNIAYPNLSLEIEVDITPNLSARLLAQEIELAFMLGPSSASSAR